MTVYRAEGGTSRNFGSFYCTEKPMTAVDAEEMFNISKWGNSIDKVVTYVIKKGTVVYEGRIEGGAGSQIYLRGGQAKGVVKVSEESLQFNTTPSSPPGSMLN